MNSNLNHLQPYPFEKLARLKQGIVPPTGKTHIALSIGEPKHVTPHIIQEALMTHMHGLSVYPSTRGLPELRQTMADWIAKRFKITADSINPETQVLPVNGTREALFSFAQCLIEPSEKPFVVMPNPFYQIYEGAALLAGAQPYFLNTAEENAYLPDFDSVPESVWQRCRLLYICSPGNPTGAVIAQKQLEQLIELAERFDFVIASDECYSEIYADEINPPIGLLEAAVAIGNNEFKRCVVFHSLSKRSNAPGLRSGFVAGDAEIMQRYFQYRTYHGCAMPIPTQHASIQAWNDETHVVDNRKLYREKFNAFAGIVSDACAITIPPGGFYIWLKTPVSEIQFAQRLFASENVTVLPGSFLSRTFNESDPGRDHVRIALVAPIDECVDAAKRIHHFIQSL